MFEILRDIQYVDLGFAFSGEVQSLDALVFLSINTNHVQIAFYIESRKSAAQEGIERINLYYKDYQ